MKTAKEWLDDLKIAYQFETMVKDYDIYQGELEELAGGFWWSQLERINMAGLEQDERKAIEAYVTTPNKTKATVKIGYSRCWFEVLLTRAIDKVDTMLSVTDKYCDFKE